MLTVREIKEKATHISPNVQGCFDIAPPLALRCIADLPHARDLIKKGEIVHAVMADEEGKYAGTVHLQEKGFWWKAGFFEIV